MEEHAASAVKVEVEDFSETSVSTSLQETLRYTLILLSTAMGSQNRTGRACLFTEHW